VEWVEIKWSKRDNWRHVICGRRALSLSKPIRFVPTSKVRSAAHRSIPVRPISVEEQEVKIKEHIIMYNPRYPVFGVSIVHELAHAKNDEMGYFCLPSLTGSAAEEFERSWTWIDEHYAYSTLAEHAETLLEFEVAIKAGLLWQVDPLSTYNLWTMKGLSTMIHDLSLFALLELWSVGMHPTISEKLGEVQSRWAPLFAAYPNLEAHKELIKYVLSNLPPRERLTRDQYLEAGLDILYSKYITRKNTTVSRDEYRRQAARIVKKVTA